jgi:hypothetical protein
VKTHPYDPGSKMARFELKKLKEAEEYYQDYVLDNNKFIISKKLNDILPNN